MGLSRLDEAPSPVAGRNYSNEYPRDPFWVPYFFNVFPNDIHVFHFVLKSTIYSYADDNTVSFIHKEFNFLKSVLEPDSLNLISWFEENYMTANPDKFQAIVLERKLTTILKLSGSAMLTLNVRIMLVCWV